MNKTREQKSISASIVFCLLLPLAFIFRTTSLPADVAYQMPFQEYLDSIDPVLIGTTNPLPRNYEPFIQDVMSRDKKFRGAMVLMNSGVGGTNAFQWIKEDLQRLKSYGANQIRLYYVPTTGLTSYEGETFLGGLQTGDAYDTHPDWYKISGEIFRRRWLPLFRELDLPIILMMGAVPSDMIKENGRLWSDPIERESYIQYLVDFAEFWKDDDVVIGFDLVNEPIPPGSSNEAFYVDNYKLWWSWSADRANAEVENGGRLLADVYNAVIQKIRKFSPDKLIVLEPGPFGAGQGFPAFEHVDYDPRLVFSMHLYGPNSFTHYGLSAIREDDLSLFEEESQYYPSAIKNWDYGIMDAAFKGARSFQSNRESQTLSPCIIYIGEFGSTCFSNSNYGLNT